MKRTMLWTAGLLLVLAVSVAAYAPPQIGLSRSDCPGKITCPLTGEEVCKDRCPLNDAVRKDCPGKIDCPLTGEAVCRDECPLGAKTKSGAKMDYDRRPCCRERAP